MADAPSEWHGGAPSSVHLAATAMDAKEYAACSLALGNADQLNVFAGGIVLPHHSVALTNNVLVQG